MKKRWIAVLLILAVIGLVIPVAAKEGSSAGIAAADFLLSATQKAKNSNKTVAETGKVFPETYDLRDQGVVTPVKFQSPWGTCWGFSAISAAETSILSEMGKTYDETGLDLSEHQLAYFTRTPVASGSSQDGEGSYVLAGTNIFNTGGFMFTATSVFSSGIGVVDESLIPYRGKEGIWDSSYYSASDDWTIDEKYRFKQKYEIEESNMLTEPAVKNYTDVLVSDDTIIDGNFKSYTYVGYNQEGTDDIKEALLDGKAVSVTFAADKSLPGQSGSATYMNNETFCHYTFNDGAPNHAVTIVGWDDTVSASLFLDHSNDADGDGQAHQPEGDGAWIVKNSWSESWGDHGYFYLSYYDHSISVPESFDFDVANVNDSAYALDEYDLMPSDNGTSQGLTSSDVMKAANVFTAEVDENVRALSCQTVYDNETVTYQVYLLNNGAAQPEDGTLAAAITQSYEYPGYHRINLPEPVHVAEGQKYAVVVTQTWNNNGQTAYDLVFAKNLNEEGVETLNAKAVKSMRNNTYSVGVINEGESFVYTDAAGAWADWSEVVGLLQMDEEEQYYDYDNFCIKAYADFVDETEAIVYQASTDTDECCYPEPTHDKAYYTLIARLLLIVFAGLFLFSLIFILVNIIKNGKMKKLKKKTAAEGAAAENTDTKSAEAAVTEESAAAETADAVQEVES